MRDKLAYEWDIPVVTPLLAAKARYCINADRVSLTGNKAEGIINE